jgi:hypothetical protein
MLSLRRQNGASDPVFGLHPRLDNGIVVGRVREGCRLIVAATRALREKLGEDGMEGLQNFVDDAGQRWKDEVLSLAGERFNRRLGDEIGAFRVEVAREFGAVRVEMATEFAAVRGEMAREFAAVRGEMTKEFAAIRTELAAKEVSLLRWSFVFWVGQLAAMTGMMAFLLRTIGRT